MVKVGRLVNRLHQLCYAHGVQLGIIDVIYKKNRLLAEPEVNQHEKSDEKGPTEYFMDES